MIIISRLRGNEVGERTTPRIVIQKPIAFPCKDSKMVPWNYDCNVMVSRGESSNATLGGAQDVSLVTLSGKIYDPTNVENETLEGRALVEEPKKGRTDGPNSSINELVIEKEAEEFLNFLKHEYSMVEQLHKQ